MRRVTMSFGAAMTYTPAHPERTARRSVRLGRDPVACDVEFQTWTNREAMARSIRMQQKREHRNGDWTACIKLTDGEGY
jgi:hypothetical protein